MLKARLHNAALGSNIRHAYSKTHMSQLSLAHTMLTNAGKKISFSLSKVATLLLIGSTITCGSNLESPSQKFKVGHMVYHIPYAIEEFIENPKEMYYGLISAIDPATESCHLEMQYPDIAGKSIQQVLLYRLCFVDEDDINAKLAELRHRNDVLRIEMFRDYRAINGRPEKESDAIYTEVLRRKKASTEKKKVNRDDEKLPDPLTFEEGDCVMLRGIKKPELGLDNPDEPVRIIEKNSIGEGRFNYEVSFLNKSKQQMVPETRLFRPSSELVLNSEWTCPSCDKVTKECSRTINVACKTKNCDGWFCKLCRVPHTGDTCEKVPQFKSPHILAKEQRKARLDEDDADIAEDWLCNNISYLPWIKSCEVATARTKIPSTYGKCPGCCRKRPKPSECTICAGDLKGVRSGGVFKKKCRCKNHIKYCVDCAKGTLKRKMIRELDITNAGAIDWNKVKIPCPICRHTKGKIQKSSFNKADWEKLLEEAKKEAGVESSEDLDEREGRLAREALAWKCAGCGTNNVPEEGDEDNPDQYCTNPSCRRHKEWRP